MTDPNDTEPLELPINGVLDLHTFRPQDFNELIPDYLAECRKLGILQIRIIHARPFEPEERFFYQRKMDRTLSP